MSSEIPRTLHNFFSEIPYTCFQDAVLKKYFIWCMEAKISCNYTFIQTSQIWKDSYDCKERNKLIGKVKYIRGYGLNRGPFGRSHLIWLRILKKNFCMWLYLSQGAYNFACDMCTVDKSRCVFTFSHHPFLYTSKTLISLHNSPHLLVMCGLGKTKPHPKLCLDWPKWLRNV